MGANTVKAFVERLLHKGSTGIAVGKRVGQWDVLPQSPIDVFAVTATLVERSGAYRHVVGPDFSDGQSHTDRFEMSTLQATGWSEIARAWGAGFHPATPRDTKQWTAFFERAKSQYPEKDETERHQFEVAFKKSYRSFTELAAIKTEPLQALWTDLYSANGDRTIVDDGDDGDWWRSAIWLMTLADMACSGVGFWPRKRNGEQSAATYVQQTVLDMAESRASATDHKSHGMLTTLASELIDSSFCAVLPKTRTSALGCTLRSMTHNLALLPSPGLVEARWRIPSEPPPRPTLTGQKDEDGTKSLNVLVVPFPYRFGAKCFVPNSDIVSNDDNQWGYFHVEQRWLHKDGELPGIDNTSANELLKFVKSLLKRGKADMDEIHAIVFPEFALNGDVFDILSKELFKDPTLEFIVAGLSEEASSAATQPDAPNRGNFVAVRARPEARTTDKWMGNHSREKHHRWKLDSRQVERYGLTNSLDPRANWWEAIPLGRRTIDFFVPRAGTALTVLICEDLARADPVQTVVRSIGPNLVLALLMDGPQRKSRWPGHYAGVLADDPGCSVLTVTSLALIARGMTSDSDQSRSVAFFKNSLGVERELFLPQGSHALALRFSARTKAEHSLDGRSDGGAAFIWELREVTPVRGEVDDSTRWIVEGST
jgi:hypothetical protein